MSLILKAARFAQEAHKGQVRKFIDEPYVYHPMRVAGKVTLEGGTEEMVCAAWLHDVIEDCDVSIATLYQEIGPNIPEMVVGLTNPTQIYDEYRGLGRIDRKAIDLAHLRKQSNEVKLIKLCDIWDNMRDFHECSSEFFLEVCS